MLGIPDTLFQTWENVEQDLWNAEVLPRMAQSAIQREDQASRSSYPQSPRPWVSTQGVNGATVPFPV